MLEHPDITNALRTGWPRGGAEGTIPCCEDCGQEVQPGSGKYDRLFQWVDEWLCFDCVMERMGEMSAEELTDILECPTKGEDWRNDGY